MRRSERTPSRSTRARSAYSAASFAEHLAGMGLLLLAKQRLQNHHHGWPLPHLCRCLLLPSFGRLLSGSRPFSDHAQPLRSALPPEPAHFMADYLVSSCGLSRAEALKASKHLTHLRTPAKPDAVISLLKRMGLLDADITRLVRISPTVLVSDPKKTLEPKIRMLEQAGFSKTELAQLVAANPQAVLRLRNLVPRIEFWRKLFGDNEKLLKVARKCNLFGYNLDEKVRPIFSFLGGLGMSDADIVRIVVRKPRFVSCTPHKIMSQVEQVKGFGVEPGSKMFVEALCAVGNLGQARLQSKMKFLRSLGWSADKLLPAFRSFPGLLRISEKKITRAMDFLVKEAGCGPSYITRRPVLLAYSMDSRLIPRCHVLQFLKKKGLPGADRDLLSIIMLSDKAFVKKFVAPISEHVPELLETYPEVSALGNGITFIRHR